MALSPLQLNVSVGLLQNQGIKVNANLLTIMNQYTSTPLIAPLLTTMSVGGSGILSNATIRSLEILGTGICPALADSTPNIQIPLSKAGFTGVIKSTANVYLGSGNLALFTEAFTAAQAYVQQSNDYIGAAGETVTVVSPVFTNMNDINTGGISNITSNPEALGNDLLNLGYLINPADLENWGSPLALVQQLVNLTGIVPPPLQIAFITLGIDQRVVDDLTNPSTSVTDTIQRTMYTAMQHITGNSLQQILQLADVKTTGIKNVADLLNPMKILPTSYQTLSVPTAVGFLPIYINTSGSVNPILNSIMPGYAVRSTDPGYQMTATDQMTFMTNNGFAVANKALALSLLQITGVVNLDLPELALAIKNIQVITQPLVNSLSTPVPGVQVIANQLAPGGTGPDLGAGNTLVISDIIGLPAGYQITPQFANTVSNLLQIDTGSLTTVYATMKDTVTGVYGNPYGQVVIPGWGTFPSAESAVSSALIPAAQTQINNIVNQYPEPVANLNMNWNTMGNEYLKEIRLQQLCGIDWATGEIPTAATVLAFVTNLPFDGTDVVKGGANDYLTAVADTTILSGQALVGVLQQGINDAAMSGVGLVTGSAGS